ncbi:hypothetical protein OAE39_01090 [Akkermansiaceae bacterium]|nr:hypothetical protein [Akkermansiaceae bacterium]
MLISAAPAEGEWKIVWADEFTGACHPEPSKWSYESGFVRNNEKAQSPNWKSISQSTLRNP